MDQLLGGAAGLPPHLPGSQDGKGKTSLQMLIRLENILTLTERTSSKVASSLPLAICIYFCFSSSGDFVWTGLTGIAAVPFKGTLVCGGAADVTPLRTAPSAGAVSGLSAEDKHSTSQLRSGFLGRIAAISALQTLPPFASVFPTTPCRRGLSCRTRWVPMSHEQIPSPP